MLHPKYPELFEAYEAWDNACEAYSNAMHDYEEQGFTWQEIKPKVLPLDQVRSKAYNEMRDLEVEIHGQLSLHSDYILELTHDTYHLLPKLLNHMKGKANQETIYNYMDLKGTLAFM